MTDIKTMSPATGEVITKTGEVVNLVDILGGATPVDETVYDIESYSPRTGLIIGSDGKAYDLVDLLQGGSGGGDVSREEFEALESRVDNIDEVILDTVEPLQKQVDKTDEKVEALWKLNRGQTYDFKEEIETGISDAPTGAKYMTLEDVQGETSQENYHMGLAVDTGQITGCAEAPIRELQMFGRTEQKRTEGTNFIPPAKPKTNLGISCTYDPETNLISFTGIATADATTWDVYQVGDKSKNWSVDDEHIVLPKGSRITVGGQTVITYLENDEFVTISNNIASVNNKLAETGLVVYRMTSRIKFAEGETPSPVQALYTGEVYEPYTGGRPSPNPDYPQEVVSVETIRICKSNNLFNPLEYYSDKNKRRSSTSSGVEWHGIPVENGRYVVTCNIASNGTALVFASNSNISPSTGENGVLGSRTVEVTNGYLWIGMYTYYLGGNPADKGNNTRNYETFLASNTKICARKESEPEFEAVYETIDIVPPRAMNKVGSYADECDVENGVWRWRTVCRTLVGDNILNITNARQRNEKYYGCEIRASAIVRNGETGLMLYSDLFTGVETMNSAGNNINGEQITIAGTAGSMVCGLSKSRFASLEEVQEYFNQHPFKVWCALKDETEEAIDAHDLDLLRGLKTTAGKTNIAIKDQSDNDVSFMFRFLREGMAASDDVVAPTPLYPSALHSVEKITVKVTGQNLFESEFVNIPASTREVNAHLRKGTYAFSFEEGITNFNLYIKLLKNGATITEGGHLSSNKWSWQFSDSSYFYYGMTTQGYKDFTLDDDYDCVIGVLNETGNRRAMLVRGDQPVYDYEPYVSEERIITPPRPLNAVDSYVDLADIESGFWKYRTESFNRDYLETLKTKGTEFYQDNPNGKITQRFYKLDDTKYVDACGYADRWTIAQRGGNNAYVSDFRVMNSGTVYVRLPYEGHETAHKFDLWAKENDFAVILALQEEQTEPINPNDLAFLRSLELLLADHHITITDQDGNDVSYLMEYIIKLSEVVS